METLNSIGLDANKTKDLANDLNNLLANFQIYYQNLRGIHWNIKGKRFFDLHVKFEELYTDANLKVDEIAERILTLGETPLHTIEDYAAQAKVPVGKNISEDEWKKAMWNIGVNGLCAITREKNGITLQSLYINQLLKLILVEAEQVATVLGINIDTINDVVSKIQKTSSNTNSMHSDIINKKQTEIEFLNGVIVRIGDLNNVPTPINRAIYLLVKHFENFKE